MDFKKESIFVTAVRSFLACFSAILGILLGIVLFVFGLMFITGQTITPEKSTLLVAPDAEGKRDLLPSSAPVVLKLNINGVIGKGDLALEKVQNLLLDSREGILHRDRVKAILLHIDSPGGSAYDADGIYRALMEYKKTYHVPIYAFVESMCASGGMYVACAADKIYATESSIIGSIGVILGPTFNVSGLMDRYGVQSMTITKGKDKDMLNPFRPWVPGEDASIRAITGELYDTFVSIVTASRPRLDRTKLINEYGAQIYVAKQAEEYGYIDVAGSDYATALSDLVQAAGLKDPHFYQVFQLQIPHPFLSAWAGDTFSLLKGKVTHVFQIGPHLDSEMSGKFLYLYQPVNLSQ